MNCDRCGKPIVGLVSLFENFLLCKDCYEKAKLELGKERK